MSPTAETLQRIHRQIPCLSQFWIPTGGIARKHHGPADAHALLVRAGFVHQTHAGIFQTLPLGQRVQAKIETLLDRRMQQDLGASKLSLSTFSSAALWKASGRLPAGPGGELFRLQDRKGADFLLSPTHEEEITSLVAAKVHSPRDLPLRLYQISRKYRDELRPRQGLLRTREFLMKDLYTFDASPTAAMRTYDAVRRAYAAFFAEDLKVPYAMADADSGAIGGDLSHEFHVLSPSGEDDLLMCDACGFCANAERTEVLGSRQQSSSDEQHCPKCKKPLKVRKSIELAHTFYLGTKYSAPLEANINLPTTDGRQRLQPLEMGCYGVGVSRIIAGTADILSDARGLGWPRAIAPFDVVVVANEQGESSSTDVASRLSVWEPRGGTTPAVDVVVDDRDKSMAWKLNDADLIGYPVIVVLGRGLKEGRCEVQCRRLGSLKQDVTLEDLPAFVHRILDKL